MKAIYKYQLEDKLMTFLHLPVGYKILTVQEQHKNIVLWAVVDTDIIDIRVVGFIILNTGQPFINDNINMDYIGTVQLMGGFYIKHIFRVIQN